MAAEPKDLNVDDLSAFETLLDALYEIPDPRYARGVRYPLGAVLGLCVLAFICGRTTLSGVSRFGADHRRLLKQLGFKHMRSPSVPTLSRVLKAVDPAALQGALARWLSGVVERMRRRGGGDERCGHIASVDGKAVRASGAHVLNVFLHDLEQVIWAAPVENKANEITVFKQALGRMLEQYPFLELVVGDAMFSGAPLCELFIENGKHYLFQVKADQPDLLEKMELVFSPHLHRMPAPEAFDGEKKKRLRCGT